MISLTTVQYDIAMLKMDDILDCGIAIWKINNIPDCDIAIQKLDDILRL